jgi:putative FmdB family regulatory protein
MPEYQYACRKCGKNFRVTMLISEHGKKKVRCPKCDSGHVAQQITAFYAQTQKKS